MKPRRQNQPFALYGSCCAVCPVVDSCLVCDGCTVPCAVVDSCSVFCIVVDGCTAVSSVVVKCTAVFTSSTAVLPTVVVDGCTAVFSVSSWTAPLALDMLSVAAFVYKVKIVVHFGQDNPMTFISQCREVTDVIHLQCLGGVHFNLLRARPGFEEVPDIATAR
ncbi:hypothetical protein FJT64_016358 [Amphibalanus amphitrite]|uniref:Uncharacterized protein n=1 Tax=Amphibalanus amphitrite TaxID=1232801 RepID=A0A6A4X161_AMPAM|nr:hypothetical protein FJT64_016358 [Amphibalanus amphitrite]